MFQSTTKALPFRLNILSSQSGDEMASREKVVVYWFTYDKTGQQRWFFATGNIENDTALFGNLLQTSGPVFGERFEPDDVAFSEVGELSIKWADCSNTTATYTVNGKHPEKNGGPCWTRTSDLSIMSRLL